jgi:hypothetical protein
VCEKINYKIVPLVNLKKNIYTMAGVELKDMYIKIGANNGSEKL